MSYRKPNRTFGFSPNNATLAHLVISYYRFPQSFFPFAVNLIAINILQAKAEKLSGFTPSTIQPEAAGRGLYARCKTR